MTRVALARGAASCVLGTSALCGAAAIAAGLLHASRVLYAPAAALFVAVLWFFRDPDRDVGTGWVAPADGRVVDVNPVADGRTRVAIYLNVLDVHVTRSPIAGTVASVEYRPGGHRLAFDKDSEHNERMIWHLHTAAGDAEVVQIAGAFVRRIVPYLPAGATIGAGTRMGLIRFGSRVDVYLPVGVSTRLTVGHRTKAGVTRLDVDG